MINILYSILTSKYDVSDSAYGKYVSVVTPSAKSDAIIDILLKETSDADDVALLAYVIVWECFQTRLADKIAVLDPVNTYTKPTRMNGNSDNTDTVFDLLPKYDDLYSARTLLDADIRNDLVAPDIYEFISGFCLQLLRNELCQD